MPGTSRKGKHPKNSKKAKAITRQREGVKPSTPFVPEVTEEVIAPMAETRPETPSTAAPAPIAILEYPYLAGELKRIGILAGAILVVLIVLAIAL